MPAVLFEDWLGISIRLEDEIGKAPRGHSWKCYEGGTNVWEHRRCLFNDRGQKVLTLLSKPKSSLIDSSSALVEIANEWLYHGIGVRGCLRLLQRAVPFVKTGISRLDLACDFVPNSDMLGIITSLAKGEMYVAGKRNGSGFWSVNCDDWLPEEWKGVSCPHCQSWGHKTSDVKWKLYYKSKELRDLAGGMGWDKPYIVDAWRECGMDIDRVWRLEVSLKHCNNLIFDGKPLTMDTYGNNSLEVYKSLYNSRFLVKRNQGHKDKTNDESVPFLPIKTLSTIKCKTYDSDRVRSGRISLLRNLVKSLEQDEVLMDAPTRDDVVEMVKGIVNRDGLNRYFEGMVGQSLTTWEQLVRDKSMSATTYPLQRDLMKQPPMQPNYNF